MHTHRLTNTTRRLLIYVQVHFKMFVFQVLYVYFCYSYGSWQNIVFLFVLFVPPPLLYFCLSRLKHCHTVHHIYVITEMTRIEMKK